MTEHISFLDRLRAAIPASARGRLHAAAAALTAVLLAYGYASDVEAAALAGVLIAVADLTLAALHAQNKLRVAMYSLAAAVAAGATSLGYMSEIQSVEVLGLLAAVLGTAGGAALTPTDSPEYVHVRARLVSGGVGPVTDDAGIHVNIDEHGKAVGTIGQDHDLDTAAGHTETPREPHRRERETPDGNWGRIDGED